MTGWHYTPTRNLDRILAHGIKPSSVKHKPNIACEIPGRKKLAVWLYLRPQTGRRHLGMLIHRAAAHDATSITVLQLDLTDCIVIGNRNDLRFWHVGNIESFRYHDGTHPEDEFVLVPHPIPPAAIVDYETFDLLELTQSKRYAEALI